MSKCNSCGKEMGDIEIGMTSCYKCRMGVSHALEINRTTKKADPCRCVCCTKMFVPRYDGVLYCSNECRRQVYNDRKRKRR